MCCEVINLHFFCFSKSFAAVLVVFVLYMSLFGCGILLLFILQLEEHKVESIKLDKAATEKLLQETIEKHQAEIFAQKEFYTSALNAAKEAEALAEERANTEARTELESRLKEAEEREAMLIQTLEELRQTLSRKEQQVIFISIIFT